MTRLTVTLVLEDGPRRVDVPPELQAALEAAGLTDTWDTLTYARRTEYARLVTEAKGEDTRLRRIENVPGEIVSDGRSIAQGRH